MITCHISAEQSSPRRWLVRALVVGEAGIVAERSFDVAAADSVPATRLPAFIERMVDDAATNVRLEIGCVEADWQVERVAPGLHVDAEALAAMVEAEIEADEQ